MLFFSVWGTEIEMTEKKK